MIFVRLGVLVAFACLGGGCRACVNDHPYVPPAPDASSTTSTLGDTDDSESEPETQLQEAVGGVEPSLVAPPGATSWQVGGLTLEAGGREIVLVLVGDFDGDSKKDALALVRPATAERKPGSSTGELVFWSGAAPGSPAGVIAAGPALGVQPTCVPTARLERIGPRSAFAEIGSSCPRGVGSRAIIVVRLGAPAPAVAFDAIVADPREAPNLHVDVDAADRDKDGIDDVVLRIALEGGGTDGAPKVAAKLAFFDRPAGPSRDPDEPDASLRVLAAQAATKAVKAKDAASVGPLVQQMRALYRAMCAEGGTPRVSKIHGGGAASCGLSKPLEDAGVAEVRAFVTQGDALRAYAAAERVQLPPATKTASKTAEIQKLLGDVAPISLATSVRLLSIPVDTPNRSAPEWGPLAFEYTGKLLVRHGKSVARVEPETGEGEPADVIAWKDEVLSPDGKSRWLEAYHDCEGIALRATFAPTGEGEMSDVVLPIAPRFGRSCGKGRGEPATAIPLAWGARGLEAIVSGHPVLIQLDPPRATELLTFTDEIPPPGSPRSHGTKTLALATPTGVLVRGRPSENRWSMVRSPDLEPYADVKWCTINDDGSRLACVRRRSVVVVTLP